VVPNNNNHTHLTLQPILPQLPSRLCSGLLSSPLSLPLPLLPFHSHKINQFLHNSPFPNLLYNLTRAEFASYPFHLPFLSSNNPSTYAHPIHPIKRLSRHLDRILSTRLVCAEFAFLFLLLLPLFYSSSSFLSTSHTFID
jgi:hypothetical protein